MTNTSSDRARREAALQRADIGAGFYNLVDGHDTMPTPALRERVSLSDLTS